MAAGATRGGAALLLGLAASCAKPDAVRVVRSPMPGLSFRIETFEGRGAVASDVTQLYASYDRGGRQARELVLDGSNLDIRELRWAAPDRLTICLADGYTGTFHNEVTLLLDGTEVHIHSRLDDACAAGANASTSSSGDAPHRVVGLSADPR